MSASMEFTDDEYALCKRQSYAVSRKWKAADAADIEADMLLWMWNATALSQGAGRNLVRHCTDTGCSVP